jgi:hypothetical protein
MEMQSLNRPEWWACGIAMASLLISVITLLRGRTQLRLSIGQQDRDDTIVVSNLSPHAIEVVALGAVKPNGCLEEFFEQHDPWLAGRHR